MSKYTDDFEEAIDLTVAPWKTLAPLCWNEPSPFRLGAKAEEHGVSDNPFKKPRTRGLFEEGRQSWRNYCGITPNCPDPQGSEPNDRLCRERRKEI